MPALLNHYIKARQDRHLSQAALAEMAGLSRMAVQKIEAGTTDPRLSSLQVLARALGMELMLVPSALKHDLEAFARSGGRTLGQPEGADAPSSIVSQLLHKPESQ